MTWAHPEAFRLLALAVPLILLHLRRRKRVRWTVPSLALLGPLLPASPAPRATGLAPRDLRGLLLELAALVLLVAALAGPTPPVPARDAHPLCIVMDGTASTAAAGRFDEMKSLAREALRHAGNGTPVLLVLAAERPFVLAGPTTDHGRVLAALSAARPRLIGGSSLRAAVGVAAGVAEGEILVLTDGDDSQSAGLEAERTGITVVSVGVEERNAALLSFVEESGATGSAALVRTRDGDGTERDRRIAVTAPAGPGGVRIPPEESGDALPADDFVRWWPRAVHRPEIAVHVATGTVEPWLAAALESSGADGVVPSLRLVDREGEGPGAPVPDLRVIEGVADPGDCPALVLDAGEGPHRSVPIVRAGESSHPLLAGVDTAEWIVTLGRVLTPDPGDTILLEGPAGPLAWAGVRDGRRVVQLGFAPSLSTVPVSGSWPVFVRNAVSWLGGPSRRALPVVVASGSRVTLRTGGAGAVWTGPVSSPDAVPPPEARARRAASGAVCVLRAPIPAVGEETWWVVLDGPGAQARVIGRAAVGLLDGEESLLVPVRRRNADAWVPSVRGAPPPPPRSPAAWFALAAAFLLVVEWWCFRPRSSEARVSGPPLADSFPTPVPAP